LRRFVNELQQKPLDCELLNRFASEVAGRGEVCDLGRGPGDVERYLRSIGTSVSVWIFLRECWKRLAN